MSHPVPTMEYENELEQIVFGTCECGEYGQIFRSGKCARCSCPICKGETAVQSYGPDCNAGCDTSVRYCIECDWVGKPE